MANKLRYFASLSTAIGGSSASGIPPTNTEYFIASKHGEGTTCYLQWKTPSHTTIDGYILVSTAGVMIRRSTSDYPATEGDGNLVLNTTDLEGTYEDTGLTAGQEYYYSIFPYSDHGVYNRDITGHAHVTAKGYVLYGIKIEKANSDPVARVTYTEDAEGMTPATMNLSTGVMNYGSWADVFFVKNNRPVMVDREGVVSYELDHDDHRLKIDGATASDIANADQELNAMSEFPTVWLKEWEDDTYQYINLSDAQVDTSYHAYQSVKRDGTISKTWYYPMFEGSVANNKLRSLSGKTPMNSNAGSTEINCADNVGPAASIVPWCKVSAVSAMLLMIGKSTNVQNTFGYGHYTGGSEAGSLLATGGTLTKGQFYGTNGNTYLKVFYIENFYGDRWDRIFGLVTNSSMHILAKMTPPYNTTGDGYAGTGVVPFGSSGGYIKETYISETGIIPKTVGGASDSTYWADGCWYDADCFALFGGGCTNGFLVGLAVNLNNALSDADWTFGASLSLEAPLL